MTSKRSGAGGPEVPGSASEPALPPSSEPEQLDLIAWLAEQERLEAEQGTKDAKAEAPLRSQEASEASALMDGAALLLRREDPRLNMRRFYRLSVARSLWGEWGVVRQWGRTGTQGQLRTDWHGEQEEAKAERTRIESAKRRRGYR